MDWQKVKRFLKKTWYFIWEDNSLASWIVNVILAFILIKFIVYPGIGWALGTTHPIVAVVSSSMEHDGNFEQWWAEQGAYYENLGITKEQFQEFSFSNGFNKGDIMILFGESPEKLKVGDVAVYWSAANDPIIHRVIKKYDGRFETKGDHNSGQIISPMLDETNISQNRFIGKAVFRIPFLGWVKIEFVSLLQLVGIIK